MPYDDEAADLPPIPAEHIRFAVDLLRSWFGQKFRHQLPPVREDQEAALRELLELMLRECPADLEMLRMIQIEAIDELPMTDEELAMSTFCADLIETALASGSAGALSLS